MTGIAAARALLVQITQDLFFHPGRSDSEMVTLYQKYRLVHLELPIIQLATVVHQIVLDTVNK
jgi:hypothetical protein